ncbi:phosphate:H+ symporter [Cladophialophora bantiana CBS 173.52]|uniref:Phosphate:H+ symporter n=1 Tax=Cladophialophora bantiana (strain ATCC 10958 / CBS 173.52 / CDC B-1940 / NIH 8579) TaxID=1442370 RepID=A0A0D2GAK7_CLAB1|nr:phosphate:H+ symporter [Cladophialophora bantiana CBS 173.52]KIW95627.1 phosphate:H+ symporter [Cladophialophora bantiana CBS 173.52]
MKWEDDGYARRDDDGRPVTFEEYQKKSSDTATKKNRWNLTKGDLKMFAITGVGFFLDSYDLFIINLVTPVWLYEYWGGLDGRKPHYPPLLRGLVNAGSNIGNIIGQLTFGFLGDVFGRKFVYGKELIVVIIGTILTISLPNDIPTPTLKMIWLFCFRILMGVGIGGDYPMSASIVSERSLLPKRGQLLGWIFSNQGWGTLTGSIATIIILASFSHALGAEGHYGQLDAVWRIQMGLGLVPAFATLYFRLTMPEGRKYLQSRELNGHSAAPNSNGAKNHDNSKPAQDPEFDSLGNPSVSMGVGPFSSIDTTTAADENKLTSTSSTEGRTKYKAFFVHFSKWKHLKVLLGTTSTWFLLDVAFYGTNLNQSVLLDEIGFNTGKNEYDLLMRNAIGNLIIAVAGYVPGYFFTIYFIEKLGRRWIQIQGFLIVALMFAIIAGDYDHLGTAGKFVCFAFAQFFFNFGPNSTTFIIPAEVYPSRVRGLAHGTSAAVGKLGAILSALLFNYLSGPNIIGLANVLWVFFACNVLGAIITFFTIPETRNKDADVMDYEEWKERQAKLYPEDA